MKKYEIYGIDNSQFYDVRTCEFAYSEDEKNEIVKALEKKFPLVQTKTIEIEFWTGNREGGEYIDKFETREEAEAAIKKYEEDDLADGTFEPNFYDVYEEEEE